MGVRAAGRAPLHLEAHLFAISFGLAGLAQSWSVAATLTDSPAWPGDALWVLTAAVWLVTVAGFIVNVTAGTRWRSLLADPVYGPFLALVFIVPMLFGAALAGHARGFGEVVFFAALIATVLIGGWMTGEWIVNDTQLGQWHPGYFLPTVAGGLIASACCAELGYPTLARLMFGYGVLCWLVLNSIVLQRLFIQPALPAPLLPTMAIELAPPVVAGSAWFEINGGNTDIVALMLAGYAILMALVQVRLTPVYVRAPFGPGSWAFAFAYAAAFTVSIRWLAAGHVHQQQVWTYLLLAVITAAIGALSIRTIADLARDNFLPRARSEPAHTTP
jgi:tellurite resistance protein